MPEYRRHRVPGGCYFFTVNLQDRHTNLMVDHIDLLRTAVRRIRTLMPFHINAWVTLPDHMHILWTLPTGDDDFPKRWQAIKMAFSRGLLPGEALTASQTLRGERGIWQRRYWEHTIRDERDYNARMDYIHFNPVKHGLVKDAAAWPFSSFHAAVKAGLYPQSWAGDDRPGPYGERSP